MLLTKYFLFILLFFSKLNEPNDTPKDKNLFISPLKIPVLLSSNFGELRIDHFHSGIDIKTQGVTGKQVVSVAKGFIYRISVSPTGFGNALYIRHQSGYSTVYAHLDRFSPEIEKYVKDQQYERKSFLITIFPPKEMFPVEQGQLIGWSGNSGSSGGPHLHFEVRKSDNENPVNPLLFNFAVTDNISPVIEKLAIYPSDQHSFINGRNSALRLNVQGGNGKYSIPAQTVIKISGNAGFGVKLFDLLNGAGNKCAAYSIQLDIDSTTVFKYVMDEFSFNDSRFINSHIDYSAYMRENIYIQRAYVQPNDKLDVYKELINRGIFNFSDNKIHKVTIRVADVNNNKSTLTFNIKSETQKPVTTAAKAKDDRIIMPYNRTNRFSDENVSVVIPSGALYDTLFFSYRKNPGSPAMLSHIYSIHNKFTPVQKPFSLSIKPDRIIPGKESKMLLVQLNDNMSKRPVTSTWSDGYVKADVTVFGNYYVGIDTIAPRITAQGMTKGINLAGRKEMRIRISDDFSGIKSYEPEIDGSWALFEYDPKNQVIIYKFDAERIGKGKKHLLSLKVEDNRDNIAWYDLEFIW